MYSGFPTKEARMRYDRPKVQKIHSHCCLYFPITFLNFFQPLDFLYAETLVEGT